MHILDFFLLAFAVIVLVAIATARISGKLPNRGLRRLAQPPSMPQSPGGAGNGSFKGIFAHHDGPVQFLRPYNFTP